MNTDMHLSFSADSPEVSSKWQEMYPLLRSLIRQQVYSYHLSSWSGQEDDIVEDILQETARRVLEYEQKAEKGKALPIYRFEHMVMVIARNCCKDMRRHDCRFTRLVGVSSIVIGESTRCDFDQTLMSEVATDQVYQ